MKGVQLDLENLDPYQVLGVGKNFTWDELKDAYRTKARLVHPDKGGNQDVFNLLTECFRELASEYTMKLEAKPHHELKKEYQNFQENVQRPVATRESKGSRDDEDFHKRFNRMFEENKLEDDATDMGYGHMMNASSATREDIDIPRTLKSFNNDKFNSAFDKNVTCSKDVIIYKEPEPLQLAKSIQYTELGGKVDDFSSSVESNSKLHYTDYMKAHTTSRLIDPNVMKERKSYKTVDDYEVARAEAVTRAQTDDEKRWMQERDEIQRKQEYDREQRLKQRDEAISKHYQRVNGLLMR